MTNKPFHGVPTFDSANGLSGLRPQQIEAKKSFNGFGQLKPSTGAGAQQVQQPTTSQSTTNPGAGKK
jgi:hypothetical protein